MKKRIASIINWWKQLMKDYETIYREAYKDPGFMIVEGYTSCGGYYF